MLVPAPHITGAPEIMPGEKGSCKDLFLWLERKDKLYFVQKANCLPVRSNIVTFLRKL